MFPLLGNNNFLRLPLLLGEGRENSGRGKEKRKIGQRKREERKNGERRNEERKRK